MIGDRIKQARIAIGMTQTEVSESLDAVGVSLTKGGLSKYERGGSVPKPTVLRALARVLGVETSFFFEEPRLEVRWLAFRKASGLGKARQERVQALVESQLEVLLELKNALEPAAITEQGAPRQTKVYQLEDAERAAQALRDDWRLGARPIDSVTSAIEDSGGVVIESGGEDDLFDGLAGWANGTVPVIVVSAAVSDDRRRFSLAHELGHLYMDVGNVDEKTEEKWAHRFAAAFLVPAEIARRELGTKRRHLDFRELGMLKKKHGLSMQAWIFRAADLGIIEQSHARTLYTEMGSRGWRRQEPVSFEGEEKPQKLRQLTVRALAEGLLSRRRAERICPGVTADLVDEELAGALDARSLLRLTRGERDRLMAQAAEIVAEDYEEGDLADFESLSEEDYCDEPPES